MISRRNRPYIYLCLCSTLIVGIVLYNMNQLPMLFSLEVRASAPCDCTNCISSYDLPHEQEDNSKGKISITENELKDPISVHQDDDRLKEIIREKFLIPPSTEPYSSEITKHKKEWNPSQNLISKYILEILQNKKNGFFIESGAYDGISGANTLFMEKNLGWNGLLIEPGSRNFEKLLKLNRKAWSSNTCISPYTYPIEIMFHESDAQGGISIPDKFKDRPVTVSGMDQCLPLYSLLNALNRTEVDFFCLDVQGAELPILQSIPWNLVQIKTFAIEVTEVVEGRVAVQKFMESKGYILYTEAEHNWDYIFYHPKYVSHTVPSVSKA